MLIEITLKRKVVGFTGTSKRNMSAPQVEQVLELLRRLDPAEVHHGDAVGADYDFHTLARSQGIDVVLHPPTNPKARAFCEDAIQVREARPYLERNQDIINECDVLIATPRTTFEERRSGTWATIRRAAKAHVPVYIVWPDGSTDIRTN